MSTKQTLSVDYVYLAFDLEVNVLLVRLLVFLRGTASSTTGGRRHYHAGLGFFSLSQIVSLSLSLRRSENGKDGVSVAGTGRVCLYTRCFVRFDTIANTAVYTRSFVLAVSMNARVIGSIREKVVLRELISPRSFVPSTQLFYFYFSQLKLIQFFSFIIY